MQHPTTSGPAGLIVIESSGEASTAAPGGAGDDATLAQVLRRLARASCVGPGVPRVVASSLRGISRFTGGSGTPVHAPIVEADCGRLAAQLNAAARQLRRTIAVAARIAR